MPSDSPVFVSLGEVSIAEFLADYWQKKPLLVRNAVAPEELTASGDDLAGLALEDWVESRIIREDQGRWHLNNGPFEESTFSQLPASHWTLLVQAVDQIIPDVHGLLDYFRFIPNWRLDDIMISYAADQGSVGPHFDDYDVFLLQGQGRRRWQLGQVCDANTPLIEGTALSLVADFCSTEQWVLEPGDMLYLPPKWAHWGVAEGECVTYSVGFRAPSAYEALSSFTDFIAQQPQYANRFQDQRPTIPTRAGQITPENLDEFYHWFRQMVDDKQSFLRWFGGEMTRNKYAEPDYDDAQLTPQEVDSLLSACNEPLEKSMQARWAYFEHGEQASLFVDGHGWSVSSSLARFLCDNRFLAIDKLKQVAQGDQDRRVLAQLLALSLLL